MTPAERAKVAALVEAAYEEGFRLGGAWSACDAKRNLDALLSEPAKGGPCSECVHRRTRYTTGSQSPAWCNQLTDDDDDATLVTCEMAGGGCWAWEPKEA